MIRSDAIALLGDLADAGYSCSIALSVNPEMVPSEFCTVGVHAVTLDGAQLGRLLDLGAAYDADLTLAGGELRYVARRAAAPDLHAVPATKTTRRT